MSADPVVSKSKSGSIPKEGSIQDATKSGSIPGSTKSGSIPGSTKSGSIPGTSKTEGSPRNSNAGTATPSATPRKGEKNCMPDNPILPDALFGSPEDKMKAHVGLFCAICCGLRLAAMYFNGDQCPRIRRRCSIPARPRCS